MAGALRDRGSGMELAKPASWRGGAIPARHTADGLDVSPRLDWTGVPAGASELVLIVEDPDAPRPEPWVHWLVYNLSPSLSCMPEGVAKMVSSPSPSGAMQGQNSWGRLGYEP